MINCVFTRMDTFMRHGVGEALDLRRFATTNEGADKRLSEHSARPTEVTFGSIDQYVFSLVQVMVDQVALHQSRVDSVQKQIDGDENRSAKSNESPKQASPRVAEALKQIPLNPIPSSKAMPEVELKNELGI